MLFNWKTSYNIISFLTKQPKQWQEYRDILKEGIQKINPKHFYIYSISYKKQKD